MCSQENTFLKTTESNTTWYDGIYGNEQVRGNNALIHVYDLLDLYIGHEQILNIKWVLGVKPKMIKTEKRYNNLCF